MTKKFNCVIIDDDPAAVDLLSIYISQIPYLHLLNTYTNPILALSDIIEKHEIDILLLDINMPEISGIELAFKLKNKVKHIIFITAHSEYAIDAFRLHASDYLLKPINISDFTDSINRLTSKNRIEDLLKIDKLFFVKGELKGKYVRVNIEDIILIYSKQHYIIIETENEQFRTNDSLKNIEDRLKIDKRFMRIHHSNIINLNKISHVNGNIIHLINNWKVPISEYYKKSFLSTIQIKTDKI